MTHRFCRRLVGYVLGPVLAIAVPMCVVAGPVRSTAAAPGYHLSRQVHHGWMDRDANSKHAWLYVGGAAPDVIAIYDLDKAGTPLIGQITSGLGNVQGITLDASGNLYVANKDGGDITIYAAGATEPTSVLSQGLNQPFCAAVDSQGDVYVTNNGGPEPDIVIYPPGQTTPSATITSSIIQAPTDAFFDVSDNFYFVDDRTGPNIIPAGSQQPSSLGLTGWSEPSGITKTSDGTLYVANFVGKRRILMYPPGSQSPSQSLKFNGNADYLSSGFVKNREYVLAPNFFSNTVSFFRPGQRQDTLTLATIAQGANGVALKPPGVP